MIWWPSKTFCNKSKLAQKTRDAQQEKPSELRLDIGPYAAKDECVLDQTVNILFDSDFTILNSGIAIEIRSRIGSIEKFARR